MRQIRYYHLMSRPDPKRPSWLRRRIENQKAVHDIRGFLRERRLSTVCESGLCPNIWDCFGNGELTFMILGERCTRRCSFCAVKSFVEPRGAEPRTVPQCGTGARVTQPVDETEPQRIADAVLELKLDYVIITSVSRDDLKDKGASLFAETIYRVKKASHQAKVEVLTPDFGGEIDLVALVAKDMPDVFGHNLEVPRRLYPEIRPQADYERSLMVLDVASRHGLLTKSGLMVGMGERKEEIVETMRDLLSAGVRILTIGQYLMPRDGKFEVMEYINPDIFEEYASIAKEIGFCAIASGPFVRSSYRAKELYTKAKGGTND